MDKALKELDGCLSGLVPKLCKDGSKHDDQGWGSGCVNGGSHPRCSKCGYDFQCSVCMVREIRDEDIGY